MTVNRPGSQTRCRHTGVAYLAAGVFNSGTLTVDGVTAVVVGMGSPAEVDDNVSSLQSPVPSALWADLTARSLLRGADRQ